MDLWLQLSLLEQMSHAQFLQCGHPMGPAHLGHLANQLKFMPRIFRSSLFWQDLCFSERKREERNYEITCPQQMSFSQETPTAIQLPTPVSNTDPMIIMYRPLKNLPQCLLSAWLRFHQLFQVEQTLQHPQAVCLRACYLAGLESYFQSM